MEEQKEKIQLRKLGGTNKNIGTSYNMFKTSKNGTRGITLIALVITIIVLLILAAVSIATLTGDNGILTKAQTAKTTNDTAQAEEEMKLLLADWQLEKKSNSSADLGDFLNEKLENGELDNLTDNGNGNYTIQRNEYETTISDENGLGEITKKEPEPPVELLNPGDKANLTQKDNYVDVNEDKATIPEGFTISAEDNTIDTGLVVTAPDESEFVWVPVPYAIATGEKTAIDAQGNKAMAVKDPTDEKYYRGLLYNFKGTGVDSYSELITGCTTTYFDENSGDREPDYLTDSRVADESIYNTLSKDVFSETTLKAEYKAMVESVEKYGGFYVGRYETSLTEDKSNVASKRGQTPMSAADTKGATDYDTQRWYGMYNRQKNYASGIKVKEKEVVGSSMIWGSQWDAMLNWILTGADKSKVTKSSTRYQGKTGNSNDVINKIYDLGNNFSEWTLAAYLSSARVARGSRYKYDYPPCWGSSLSYPSEATVDFGSRLALYIK